MSRHRTTRRRIADPGERWVLGYGDGIDLPIHLDPQVVVISFGSSNIVEIRDRLIPLRRHKTGCVPKLALHIGSTVLAYNHCGELPVIRGPIRLGSPAQTS